MHNFIFINKSWKNASWSEQTILSSTAVFNIDNDSALVRLISEGSCDTEDWRNDAGNSALHHRNKLHLKIYSNRKQFFLTVIIFHNFTVFTIFLIK